MITKFGASIITMALLLPLTGGEQDRTLTPETSPTTIQLTNDNFEDKTRLDLERNFEKSALYKKFKSGQLSIKPNAAWKIPVWGKYCGPGHSGPGQPSGALDTACMHHDQCYGRRGYGNKGCDLSLIGEIYANYKKMWWLEKYTAGIIIAAFGAKIQYLGDDDVPIYE